MAYDPTKPATNSPISSAELRSQLTGLKALIDAKTDMNAVNNQIAIETAGTFSGVAYPNITISNPPTQAEVQAVLDLVFSILDAGRRA